MNTGQAGSDILWRYGVIYPQGWQIQVNSAMRVSWWLLFGRKPGIGSTLKWLPTLSIIRRQFQHSVIFCILKKKLMQDQILRLPNIFIMWMLTGAFAMQYPIWV